MKVEPIFKTDPDLAVVEELVSYHSINPFIRENSSARGYMMSQHMSQCLTILGGDEKLVQSGLEKQFGENTFSVKTDKEVRVHKIIPRYGGIDDNSVRDITEITYIVEDVETGEFDYISVPRYHKLHQYFGFEYKPNHKVMDNITPGVILPKDTILADSPQVTTNSGYKFGVNANVCLLNIPETAEDGVIISRRLANKCAFKLYETRVVEFGEKTFPLNLYGDENNYKAFPEIGELINQDSVVMALREINTNLDSKTKTPKKNESLLAPALTSINDVREFNPTFDKAYYCRAPGKIVNIDGVDYKSGEVVDIKVYTNPKYKKEVYTGVANNIDKYADGLKRYYNKIIEAYEYVKDLNYKRYGNYNVAISERFHKLIVDAIAIGNPTNNKIKYTFKNEELDLYRIEFTICYVVIPGPSFKVSDSMGSKGVIVQVRDDDKMPYTIVDGEKIIADVVMDPSSVVSRLNIGRLYEHYFNAISRKTQREMRKIIGNEPIDKVSNNKIKQAYDFLLGLLEIIGTEQYTTYSNIKDINTIKSIVKECVEEEVYILYRVSSTKRPYQIVLEIRGTPYEPPINNVMVPIETNNTIDWKVTKNKALIAPIYTILLNKTADTFLSVAGAKLNHFGVPITVNNSNKYSLPWRPNPTKILSETEGRLYTAYVSRLGIAELKDRANSIPTHEHIYRTILDAPKPTDIDVLVDRTSIPYGHDSALELVNNIFNSAGIEIDYVKDTKVIKKPTKN